MLGWLNEINTKIIRGFSRLKFIKVFWVIANLMFFKLRYQLWQRSMVLIDRRENLFVCLKRLWRCFFRIFRKIVKTLLNLIVFSLKDAPLLNRSLQVLVHRVIIFLIIFLLHYKKKLYIAWWLKFYEKIFMVWYIYCLRKQMKIWIEFKDDDNLIIKV